MPLLFWLDIANLIVSTVIAAALALMVLGTGPRRALNRLFALFTLAEATWATLSLLLRMALWLQVGNPTLLLELATFAFALTGPLLLLFTVRYVSATTTAVGHIRWANLAAVLGLATMTILSISLFRHQVIFNPRLHTSGVTIHNVSTLGFILASLPTLYVLWSLALFWQERRRINEPYLAASVLVLLVGFAVGGLFNPPFPIMSITTTFSIAVLGYGVISRQLFNPLRELGDKLEHRAEETRKQTERLAVINHITNVIGVTLHLDDLMEVVYLEIVPAFHPDAFFIALYDGNADELDFCFIVDEGVQLPSEQLPLGIGLTSIVVTKKQPLLIRDLEREKNRLPLQAISSVGKSAVSWLGVPMLIGERVLGVINVQAYRPHAWDEEDELLLSTIADQVALALEKARLFQERERRVTELAIVNEIGHAVSSTLEIDDLLETVHQQVNRLFDTTNFFIATYEEKNNEWAIAFHVEHGQPQPTGQCHKVEVGLTGDIIRNRQHLFFQSAEEILAFHKSRGIDPIGPMANSWLGVPLIAADKVVGVMGIQSYEQENLYDEQDLALFSTVAAQVATALDNLRLLEQARHQAQEMEVINEIGGVITSVLDLDGVLRQIVDTTKTRFGHYYVGIMLVEKDQLVVRSTSAIGDSDVRPDFSVTSIPLTHSPSLIAEAARTSQPVLVNDAPNNPRYLTVPELPDTRCELCLPIKTKGRVIGVLDVQSDRPFAYDQSDVALLQSLADQAGVAIENARLFKDVHTHVEELAALNELGQALTARLNVEKVLEEAYRQASRLLDTTNFYIGLYDPEKHEIHFALNISESSQDKNITTISADHGIGGYIVRNRASVLIQGNLRDWEKERGIKSVGDPALSWMGVPLIIGDRVLGVMAAQSYTTPHLYDEHDRELLTAIASQTAIAIQNARLYEAMQQELVERKRAEEKAQRRAAQATLIYKVGQRVSGKLELEALLSEVVTAVRDAFDYYNVMLMLLDEGTERLTLQSIAGEYVDVFPKDLSLAVGEGMVGCAATTGETQVSGDVSKNPHYVRKANETTKSELVAPIKSGQKVIGVLDLQNDDLDAFDETDVILVETLANQIAAAIKNAHLYEQAQQSVLEQRSLREAALALMTTLDRNEVTERILAQLQEVVPYDTASVQLLRTSPERDLRENWLEIVGGRGFPNLPDLIGFAFPVSSDNPNSEVIHTRAPYIVKDAPAVYEEFRHEPHAQANIHSWLGVPMLVGDRLVGMIALDKQESDFYTEEYAKLALTFAAQAAVAIENAQLYEQAQHEITERKRAEEQLRHYAAEMERANEQVKRFAYIVSHDLRAPLVNLKGFASELRIALGEIQSVADAVQSHLNEEQRQTLTYALQKDAYEALEFIDSSATRMDHFITALLKLSRLGRRELELKPIDVGAIIQATLPTLAHQIAEHQVKVTVDTLPEVIADRTSIEQVVGNILSNAVKYLSPDRPGEIEITAERTADETIFHIQDNGRGIAEGDMDKVFAPFRRAGKQDIPGEGMGLAYVQALVRRHGGRIWCESELGVGTVITFTIPNRE